MSDDAVPAVDESMNPAIDKMWLAYQRFKTLGASDNEAALLAGTFLRSAIAIVQGLRAGS